MVRRARTTPRQPRHRARTSVSSTGSAPRASAASPIGTALKLERVRARSHCTEEAGHRDPVDLGHVTGGQWHHVEMNEVIDVATVRSIADQVHPSELGVPQREFVHDGRRHVAHDSRGRQQADCRCDLLAMRSSHVGGRCRIHGVRAAPHGSDAARTPQAGQLGALEPLCAEVSGESDAFHPASRSPQAGVSQFSVGVVPSLRITHSLLMSCPGPRHRPHPPADALVGAPTHVTQRLREWAEECVSKSLELPEDAR